MLTRKLLRDLLALLMLAQPALAQVNFFSDEKARERLAELEQQFSDLNKQLRRAEQESARLIVEKQQLLDNLRGLSAIVEETSITAARQVTRIEEIDAKFREQIIATGNFLDQEITKLKDDLEGAAPDVYKEAMVAYANADIESAEKFWLELLNKYPSSDLVPPTRIWLARIEISRGALIAAEDELLALLTEFPQHQRVPDLLILLAEIADLSGDDITSTYWRQRLFKSYPASAATDHFRLEQLRSVDHEAR